MVDFVRAHPDMFNPLWTLDRARAEEQNWHADLAVAEVVECTGVPAWRVCLVRPSAASARRCSTTAEASLLKLPPSNNLISARCSRSPGSAKAAAPAARKLAGHAMHQLSR
jgi:hypothetical protein